MGKTALLFTGQGSQVSGMGLDFYQNFECSKKIFDEFSILLFIFLKISEID